MSRLPPAPEMRPMSDSPVNRDYSDAEIERLLDQHWQSIRPAPSLPPWVPFTMRLLPWTLLTVTIVNGLIGILAILTPLLAAQFGEAVADPLYAAYANICPQRPSHTFFLLGHPMAFEQRDLSMHLGFALAGLLYMRAGFLRRPLPTWFLIAGLAPMLVDVVLSTIGTLPATAISRTWTGGLAGFVVVWWSYPRYDAMFARVQQHVALIEAKTRESQPEPDWFVVAGGTSNTLGLSDND